MISAASRLQRRRKRTCITSITHTTERTVRALHETFQNLLIYTEHEKGPTLGTKEDDSTNECIRTFDRLSERLIRTSSSTWPMHIFSPSTTIHSRVCVQPHTFHQLQHHQRQKRWYGGGTGDYSMTPESVLSYLESRDVDTSRHRRNGSHIILRECPFCEKTVGGKIDNMYKCYIRINQGMPVYHCHRCGKGGSWFDLKKKLGDFEVESVHQVARKAQREATASSTHRAMSTWTAPASTSSWQNSKFSASTSSNSSSRQTSYKVTTPALPDFSKRGYEDYLKPPPSHPDSGRRAAPLPMPAQKLQAIYSTKLLDGETTPVRDYLTKTRGLSVKTLRKYGVGQAPYRFPTDENQWVVAECVTFPWILSVSQIEQQELLRGSHFEWTGATPKKSEDEMVETTEESRKGAIKKSTTQAPPSAVVKDSTFVTRRVKVRAIENKAWQRMDPPGGGWGLFGWHTIPSDAKELVVTEGEYDAMAVYQATGRPAVSLPNGCRSLPVEILPLLENIEKIYLWMDNDAAGQEGAESFAKKLGLERTYLVRPTPSNTFRLQDEGSASDSTESIDAPKDANEALLDGLDLERIIADAKLIPHERIMTFENLRDDVLHEILYPENYIGTPIPSLPGLTALMSGLRRGELTVITGPTGSGKTTFLGQLSLDLAEQGTNMLWGSFEIKNTRLMHKLLQQFAREPLPKGDLTMKDKMHAIADRFQQLPLYFLTFHGGSDVDQVLEAMDYAGTNIR